MRVMVTGATTPLGVAIVRHLLVSRDVELVLAVGREAAAPSAYTGDRIVYRAADLSHPRVIHDLVWGPARDLRIAAIVHGMQHRAAHDRGRAVYVQNVRATRDLLVACGEHPTIRRFVYRSFAEVYGLGHATSDLIDEESPLDFDPSAPQWVRDRVEADFVVCEHLASRLEIAVLRCAEILAPDVGSQLWDYLSSRVCLRPLGFDPMINVLSLDDAATAFGAALASPEVGIFNIPGHDTLPLSRAIAESGKANIPVPGPLMSPLYRLRRAVSGFDFRYDINNRRFHFGGVLDGTRARTKLGYAPRVPVRWPRAWWRNLLEQLAEARA
jgi:UDP-glucose 4-epimerase